MKPKKLIRSKIIEKLKPGEWEEITDMEELNKLYALKIQEELIEIQNSKHKDAFEFADLIEAACSFAKVNGFPEAIIATAILKKENDNGVFGYLALNNLNPNNPSNEMYFEAFD